jgi:hypothetical protein
MLKRVSRAALIRVGNIGRIIISKKKVTNKLGIRHSMYYLCTIH